MIDRLARVLVSLEKLQGILRAYSNAQQLSFLWKEAAHFPLIIPCWDVMFWVTVEPRKWPGLWMNSLGCSLRYWLHDLLVIWFFTSSSSQNVKAVITVTIAKHHNQPQISHFFDIYKYRKIKVIQHTHKFKLYQKA